MTGGTNYEAKNIETFYQPAFYNHDVHRDYSLYLYAVYLIQAGLFPDGLQFSVKRF